MSIIHIDADTIRAAAEELHDNMDEPPALDVVIAAVSRWMELSVETILQDPTHYALRGVGRHNSEWDSALEWAENRVTP